VSAPTPTAFARPAGVPESAKLKTIKPLEWEGRSATERIVWINETTGDSKYRRTFDVHAQDGALLGGFYGAVTSIDTKIAGTRLRREGRRRMLWFPEGESWNHHESQAAVIRRLLDDRDRAPWRPGR